jgi:hypothetical protein
MSNRRMDERRAAAARLSLITLEAERLWLEGQRCEDLERMKAIQAEMHVLYNSAFEIRREQLLEDLEEAEQQQEAEPTEATRRRRWWRFWR